MFWGSFSNGKLLSRVGYAKSVRPRSQTRRTAAAMPKVGRTLGDGLNIERRELASTIATNRSDLRCGHATEHALRAAQDG
jgi:hypothetical protein